MITYVFRRNGTLTTSAKHIALQLRGQWGGVVGLSAQFSASGDVQDHIPPHITWTEFDEWPTGYSPRPEDPIAVRHFAADLVFYLREIDVAIYLEERGTTRRPSPNGP